MGTMNNILEMITEPLLGTVVLAERDGQKPDKAELMAQLDRGEHVEVDILATTYVRGPEIQNSKRQDLSLKAMRQFAKLSKQQKSPFQRDHSDQTQDKGGFVVDSKVQKTELGHELVERIRLNTPWAVRGALTGNMDKFSIGYKAEKLDDIHCSSCQDGILQCGHFRGQEITKGKKTSVVKYEYKTAIPLERSWVVNPAVRETKMRSIESQLSASLSALPQKESNMDSEKLAVLLGCESDAILSNVTVLKTSHAESQDKLAAVMKELSDTQAKLSAAEETAEKLMAEKNQVDCDTLIEALLSEGAIVKDGHAERGIREAYSTGNLKMAELLAAAQRENVPVSKLQSTPEARGETLLSDKHTDNDGKVDYDSLFVKLCDMDPDKKRVVGHLRPQAEKYFQMQPEDLNRVLASFPEENK